MGERCRVAFVRWQPYIAAEQNAAYEFVFFAKPGTPDPPLGAFNYWQVPTLVRTVATAHSAPLPTIPRMPCQACTSIVPE